MSWLAKIYYRLLLGIVEPKAAKYPKERKKNGRK